MTVFEYREKHPNCFYCNCNPTSLLGIKCSATGKTKNKRRAKKCPCYVPAKSLYDVRSDTE